MRLHPTMLAAAALVALWAMVATAQVGTGVVRVEVTDSSGGRLPGVAVVATALDGHVLATAVTDRTGTYVFRAVAAGPVMLRFQLEGFAGALAGLTVQSGAESRVAQRLELAPLSETVMVEAPAPIESAPPPAPAPARPPRPAPVTRSVPSHDRDSVCGPAKPDAAADSLGTILSSRDVAQGDLYSTGAEVIVDGGLQNGLDVGQNLVVRRYYRVRGFAGADTMGEHSAGLVQIVTVNDRMSIGVVLYACDELRRGDFLASFKPEVTRLPDPRGSPDYGDAARILFADEGQVLGAPRRLMVIDRGSDRGVRVGQRLTLFRRQRHLTRQPSVVGDAVVVAVRTDSATIRIERVRDAVTSGDMAAPQTAAPVASR